MNNVVEEGFFSGEQSKKRKEKKIVTSRLALCKQLIQNSPSRETREVDASSRRDFRFTGEGEQTSNKMLQ
ncbi:hypothetical protein KFK09_007284 [Dendrobium nobile]|uniref:Uncharacterized protein n=1 Tax=Dendrobium nobile TaxID=94219 RepID=A0A8T3BWE6_DENNO|nr:hypothetical protein KFK09_007284 [Dendrobium nobile]